MSKKPSFKYKVVEPNDDYRKAVIEKSGASSVEFTLEQLQQKRVQWSEEKRQLQGQLTVDQAKAENILHHHPFLKEMKEEDQYTVWMFYEAMKSCTELQKQIDLRISALDEYMTEEQHILKTLGFEKTDTPAV